VPQLLPLRRPLRAKRENVVRDLRAFTVSPTRLRAGQYRQCRNNEPRGVRCARSLRRPQVAWPSPGGTTKIGPCGASRRTEWPANGLQLRCPPPRGSRRRLPPPTHSTPLSHINARRLRQLLLSSTRASRSMPHHRVTRVGGSAPGGAKRRCGGGCGAKSVRGRVVGLLGAWHGPVAVPCTPPHSRVHTTACSTSK
jgi:hypothetical protein